MIQVMTRRLFNEYTSVMLNELAFLKIWVYVVVPDVKRTKRKRKQRQDKKQIRQKKE